MKKRPGLSLLEMVVALALMSLIIVFFVDFFLSVEKESTRQRISNALSADGLKAVNDVGGELYHAKEIFYEDARGQSFRNLLDLGAIVPLADSRLPVQDPNGVLSPTDPLFEPDNVGNQLLFLRSMAPFRHQIGGIWRQVSVYKLCFVYLRLVPSGLVRLPGEAGIIELRWWESGHYADLTDLSALAAILTPAEMDEYLLALAEIEITRAWDGSAPDAATTFNDLTPGAVPFNSLSVLTEIDPDQDRLLLLNSGRVETHDAIYSVAFNGGYPGENANTPRFAAPVNEFPGGFEVVAVGQQSSLRIYLRLVIASIYQRPPERLLAREHTVLVSPGVR